MKKLFVVLCLMATGVFSVNAQDATTTAASGPIMSKRGYPILPQGGDWSISFDAIPVLNFVGNAFSLAGTNTISSAFPSTNVITARKFIDDNTAYRAQVRFDLGTQTTKHNTASDVSGAPAGTTVEDKQVSKNSNIVLAGGLEKRKGTGRVQGIYGAMASINFGRGSSGGTNTYTYGNSLNTTTGGATTHNFSTNSDAFVTSRTTKTTTAGGFGIGVVGFLGAEYFVAPKLSIGAEFQWGPSFQSTGKSTTTTESLSGGAVKSTTTTSAGGSSLKFNTAVTSINLNFFF